jgi:uncharacterized membrane protein
MIQRIMVQVCIKLGFFSGIIMLFETQYLTDNSLKFDPQQESVDWITKFYLR